MITISIKNKNSMQKAAEIVKNGGVFVFPTDTIYAIGCGLTEHAIKKMYQIKKRSLMKPSAVLLNEPLIPDILRATYKKHEPGRLTIIANVDKYSVEFPKVLLKNNKIGARIPNDKWLQGLMKIAGPIVASSANNAGERAPEKFEDIDSEILEKADLVIKSDRISQNPPSAIYDYEDKKFLRF